MTFTEIIQKRRSIYSLGKESKQNKESIIERVKLAVLHTPSAFNSQSARVILLFNENSDKLWEITRRCLQKIVPANAFENTSKKIDSFKAGFGTVLFFEDQTVVNDLMSKYAAYKDNFPLWSLQSNGMLQYHIWLALAEMNIGASLQHYNPIIDEEVRKEWNINPTWKLLAEMPFGSTNQPANAKDFQPIEQRLKIF